ncbi:integrase catalytic domain-containing protein [Trichonephila clavipes]|nr:integrase catalytic domain-containing protein [Trichonephila clavipes]
MSLFPSTARQKKNKGSYFPGQRLKPPPNIVHFRPHSFPTLLEKVELRSRKCLYCNKGHELYACHSFSANEKEFRNREAEVSDEENIDNDIMSDFEAGISYQNKWYKVKIPWKPNMKTLLENNEEIARKRFLKLRSCFKNDSSLFEDYKLVVNNHLSEKIIERVPFEEENLKHNIFYLPHRAVIRTDKTTSKLRIVFDASSHAKAQLSLNDCLHTGLNFIPNLFFLLIKFRVNPIAFVADIKMAFLMIEIDESERDFTRFFWDENPGIDLENKRLDIFRMTRVLFGEIWCLGLDWDDKLPKQLEVSWNKWCNEIHYLSEIKIPGYYFQNFLPSNATTMQLHCFSDASKKAYGTVAYLRIELNDGNNISSFVASKGRVAPLNTLSIPRLELMGTLLSARLSDKIGTALILPVSRFYWTDSSITCYWIKGDFNKHKVFVKNRIKEIQKLSDPKEWRYCKGKDNPADLISRGLPLNDLKNNKIWWHGPKWLTMKQTEWPLFSEPIIETEINNDKLELKKSINV